MLFVGAQSTGSRLFQSSVISATLAHTMPKTWSDDVFDYDFNQAVLADIDSLDIEEGRWFKCKFCVNSRDTQGKFSCRPFAAVELTGPRGHLENKSHKDKKAQSMGSSQGSAAASLETILQIKVAAKIPEQSDKQDPPTTTACKFRS